MLAQSGGMNFWCQSRLNFCLIDFRCQSGRSCEINAGIDGKNYAEIMREAQLRRGWTFSPLKLLPFSLQTRLETHLQVHSSEFMRRLNWFKAAGLTAEKIYIGHCDSFAIIFEARPLQSAHKIVCNFSIFPPISRVFRDKDDRNLMRWESRNTEKSFALFSLLLPLCRFIV